MSAIDLQAGWRELNELARDEYMEDLSVVILESAESLAFRRIGRLMGVWIKSPFADPLPYDVNLPWNWAKSHRAWQIRRTIPQNLAPSQAHRHQLLKQFATEWHRPLEEMAEFNVFLSICKRIRPVVCDETSTLDSANAMAEDLRNANQDVISFDVKIMTSVTALSIAEYLAQHVPLLHSAGTPLVTGVTLLVLCFGRRKACGFLTDVVNRMMFERTGSQARSPVRTGLSRLPKPAAISYLSPASSVGFTPTSPKTAIRAETAPRPNSR